MRLNIIHTSLKSCQDADFEISPFIPGFIYQIALFHCRPTNPFNFQNPGCIMTGSRLKWCEGPEKSVLKTYVKRRNYAD